MNYVLGVTSCKPWDYFWGTFIGILPGTMIFVYAGVNLKSIEELITGKRPANFTEILFFIMGGIAVITIFFLINKEAKKQL